MSATILLQRLNNQRLVGEPFEQPEEVVAWLGAVQAQEFSYAKWGLGQRMRAASEACIQQAFDAGRILRTHVMRPTWHFVAPPDLRWLLQLTGPRVHAFNAYYYRKQNLDEAVLDRCHAVLRTALQGGQQLMRTELEAKLREAGILAPHDDRLRLAYIMMHAELEGLICSGALRGKQHTYALLEERVPMVPAIDRETALVELTRRYFTSHGPATVQDFAWWSGLTVADIRRGIALAGPALVAQTVGQREYWRAPDMPWVALQSPQVHLLQPFDDLTISYKNHELELDPQFASQVAAVLGVVFTIDGRIAGGWKRTMKKNTVTVMLQPFRALSAAEEAALAAQAQRFGAFLEKEVVLEWSEP